MKKENRILKSSDFAKVYDYRHKYNSASMGVYYKGNDLDHLRVGLSVSKKVGKAYVRVRVRRLIRALFDKYKAYSANYDVVVVAKKGFEEKTFDELYEELRLILNRFIKENLDEETN